MENETLGRIIGSFVGAALLVAGMALLSPNVRPLNPHVVVHTAIELPAMSHAAGFTD